MDKQEYNDILRDIKRSFRHGDYERVIAYAREMDLDKVRDNTVLDMISDSYDIMGRYDIARDVLLLAYERAPLGRKMAYKLAVLSIKLEDLDNAVEFYNDFCRMAPKDNNRYLLKYLIGRAGGISVQELIKVLEKYLEDEFDEKWQYELARLYHEAGMEDKCVQACDDIILWYSDGEYVKKALELKFMHKALNPAQQVKYESMMNSYSYEEEEYSPEKEAEEHALDEDAEEFASNFLGLGEDAAEELADEFIANNPLPVQETPEQAAPSEDWDYRIDDVDIQIEEPEEVPEDITAEPVAETVAEPVVLPVAETVAEPVGETFAAPVAEPAAAPADETEEAAITPEEAAIIAVAAATGGKIGSAIAKKSSKSYMVKKPELARDSLDTPAGLHKKSRATFKGAPLENNPDGQIGLNVDELSKKEGVIAGQITIDEALKSYSKKLENNEESVAAVEAERLKMIQEHVASTMVPAKLIHIEDEDEISVDDIEAVDHSGEVVEIKDEEELFSVTPIPAAAAAAAGAAVVAAEAEPEVDDIDLGGETFAEEFIEETEDLLPGEKDAVVIPEELEEVGIDKIYEPYVPSDEDGEFYDDEEPEEEYEEEPAGEPETEETVVPAAAAAAAMTAEEAIAAFEQKNAEAKAAGSDELDSLGDELFGDFFADDETQAEAEEIAAEEVTEEVTEEVIEEAATEVPAAAAAVAAAMTAEEAIAAFEEAKAAEETKTEAFDGDLDAELDAAFDEAELDAELDAAAETELDADIEAELDAAFDADDLEAALDEASEEMADEAPEEAEEEAQESEEELYAEYDNEEVKEEPPVIERTQRRKALKAARNEGYVLDDEQRENLAEFLLVDNMEVEICRTIDGILNYKKGGDTTGGNLIVTGDAKSGKTFLTISVIKIIAQEMGEGNGKVAKVQAEALNGKSLEKVFAKIQGSDLIIENVGYLEDATIKELITALENGKTGGMVVLEGNQLAIENILSNFPSLKRIFKNRVDIAELTINQWADLACEYAKEEGYEIDDLALLALYARIDEMNVPTAKLGYQDITNLVDRAITKAEKRNVGKLFSAFSKKKSDSLKPLAEADFDLR